MPPADFTPHDGGPCPVEPFTPVSLIYRGPEDPAKGVRIPFAAAARMDWSHDGGPDDIIAYRVEKLPWN